MLIFRRVRELRKVTVSLVVSVCFSVSMELLPDFMYFIDVNILGSQHVHGICWLNLLEGLKMTV